MFCEEAFLWWIICICLWSVMNNWGRHFCRYFLYEWKSAFCRWILWWVLRPRNWTCFVDCLASEVQCIHFFESFDECVTKFVQYRQIAIDILYSRSVNTSDTSRISVTHSSNTSESNEICLETCEGVFPQSMSVYSPKSKIKMNRFAASELLSNLFFLICY